MTIYRAAREYLRAQLALRNAIQAGNAQATVDALQGTATAMHEVQRSIVRNGVETGVRIPYTHQIIERLAGIWDRWLGTAIDTTIQATFLTTADEPDELAANALQGMFTEPGADWIDLQATAVCDAEVDDIIVVGYRDDGDDVPDAIVSVVLELATWCREQAKGVQNGKR